jgi:hypothetical protein
VRDRAANVRKYVVVQRTGFVPYFVCAWHDGAESWGCERARALSFDARLARQIANQLNARHPGSPLPVVIEEAR